MVRTRTPTTNETRHRSCPSPEGGLPVRRGHACRTQHPNVNPATRQPDAEPQTQQPAAEPAALETACPRRTGRPPKMRTKRPGAPSPPHSLPEVITCAQEPLTLARGTSRLLR